MFFNYVLISKTRNIQWKIKNKDNSSAMYNIGSYVSHDVSNKKKTKINTHNNICGVYTIRNWLSVCSACEDILTFIDRLWCALKVFSSTVFNGLRSSSVR